MCAIYAVITRGLICALIILLQVTKITCNRSLSSSILNKFLFYENETGCVTLSQTLYIYTGIFCYGTQYLILVEY